MYNPYEFQNDLSRSQSEVGNMISGRAEQLKAIQAPGIIKKAEALKKKGIALQKGAQDVQSAIELGLGAPAGPIVAEKIINPVIDKISSKFPSIGKRIEQGKGIISDIKGQVQKIGGQLTKNNPIRSIQDEIQSRVSGVQSRVGGAQVAPEEQSPLDFMRENMGGFRVPTRVEEAVQNVPKRLEQSMVDRSGISSEEDMANQRELFGDGETKGEDVIADNIPDVVPSAPSTTAGTTALDTTLDTGADVAVDTGLGAVAAADAWNPIGWIIGAGLAIGAVTEAVGAVNDQAKATADQATADQVKLPQQAPVNFAGSLVTPIQNALARTQ